MQKRIPSYLVGGEEGVDACKLSQHIKNTQFAEDVYHGMSTIIKGRNERTIELICYKCLKKREV